MSMDIPLAALPGDHQPAARVEPQALIPKLQWSSPDAGIRVQLFERPGAVRARIHLWGAARPLEVQAPTGARALRVSWIPKDARIDGVGGQFYFRLRWLDGKNDLVESYSNDPLLCLPCEQPGAPSPCPWQRMKARIVQAWRMATRALVHQVTSRMEIAADPVGIPMRSGGPGAARPPGISFARTDLLGRRARTTPLN